MNRRSFRSLASLGAFLAATGVAALAGSLATRDAIDSWYQELRKPFFNPPSWVFAPVWTLLYGAMATAGWLTWRKRSTHQQAVDRATRVFGLQLLLNAAWSGMFFGLRRPLLGLLDILALLATLVYWLRAAGRVEPRTRPAHPAVHRLGHLRSPTQRCHLVAQPLSASLAPGAP